MLEAVSQAFFVTNFLISGYFLALTLNLQHSAIQFYGAQNHEYLSNGKSFLELALSHSSANPIECVRNVPVLLHKSDLPLSKATTYVIATTGEATQEI